MKPFDLDGRVVRKAVRAGGVDGDLGDEGGCGGDGRFGVVGRLGVSESILVCGR